MGLALLAVNLRKYTANKQEHIKLNSKMEKGEFERTQILLSPIQLVLSQPLFPSIPQDGVRMNVTFVHKDHLIRLVLLWSSLN